MTVLRRAVLAALLAVVSRETDAQAVVAGTVYDSLVTRAALADAQVTIIELGRMAPSDKRGRFRFDSVPAGTWTLTFLHPLLDSLDMSAPEVKVLVPPAGTLSAPLATPSPATIYATLCRGVVEAKTGVIFGRVRSAADGKPVAGVRVFGSWLDMLLAGGRVRRDWRELGVLSGARGQFFLCGIPHDVAVDIRAARGMLAAGPVQVQIGETLIAHLDFTVPALDVGARLLPGDSGRSLLADSAAAPGSAILTGVVKNPDGSPVPDALVGVLGFTLSARTSTTGQFAIARVPAGTRTLQLRALGLAPRNMVIDLPEDGRLEILVAMDKRPQTLATIAVQGDRDRRDVPHTSTGFDARQRAGLGRYITGDDIRARGAASVIDVLAMSPGVSREWSAAGPTVTIRGSGGRCIPSIFLDNISLSTGERGSIGDLDGVVRPEAIQGVEVYAGAFIPPQFDRSSTTGCGTIVIWTRR